MAEYLFIWSTTCRCHRGGQGRVKPSPILVRTLQIEIRWPGKIFPLLLIQQHDCCQNQTRHPSYLSLYGIDHDHRKDRLYLRHQLTDILGIPSRRTFFRKNRGNLFNCFLGDQWHGHSFHNKKSVRGLPIHAAVKYTSPHAPQSYYASEFLPIGESISPL